MTEGNPHVTVNVVVQFLRWIAFGVAQRDGLVTYFVRDNGVGFDVRRAMGRTGLRASLGLQGMQERAAAIGGSVDIESKLRRGTKVQATLLIRRTPSS